MRKRTATLALGAVVGFTTMVSAADMRPRSVPPEKTYTPDFSWAGLYLGLHGGAARGASHDSEEPTVRLGGQYIGAQVGFNALVAGNLVLGIEGDISAGGPAGFVQYIDNSDPLLGPVTLTEQIQWFASLRGRAGLAMGDWMPYVTAGWARGDSTRTTGQLQIITHGHSGWTIGAGVEWMFAPHWTVKGEYKYYSFGPVPYEWAVGGPSSVNFNFSTAEIGLNYKF
jgi:opacity protein-like surface antigen